MLYVLLIESAAFSQPFYRIQQSLSWAFHGLAVASLFKRHLPIWQSLVQKWPEG